MESTVGFDSAASDAELISRVRDGDRVAFGELYGRHSRAAGALARQLSVSGAEADDLVAESFARVLDTMLDGRGPDSAFRAYLFTTLRHTAYDRTRKDKRLYFTDDITAHETPEDVDDPVLLQMENSFVAKAFGQLPQRWQTILWHTQVEGQSPAEVGVILGMTPNAVTSLAFRAREGLREAYLQVHMAETVAERCRATIDRLGAYTRGGLSKRESTQVQTHLAECDRCPALAAELSEINSGLRGLLAPLLLGSAAAGYIATLPAVPVLTQVGASVTGAGVGGSLAKLGVATKVGTLITTPAVVTGGVLAAAVVTITAVVVGIATPGGTNNTADPQNPPASGGAPASAGTPNGLDPFAGIPGVTVTPPTTDGLGNPVEATQDNSDRVPPVDPGVLAGGPDDLPEFGGFPGTGVPSVPAPADPVIPPAAGNAENPTDPPTRRTVPAAPGATAPTAPAAPVNPTPTTPTPAPGVPPVDTPPIDTPPVAPPPAGPVQPLPPTPAAVNVNVTTGIDGFTAGRTQSVRLSVTNSGGSVQPAGTATLTAGRGVRLVGADVSTPALRTASVAFARSAPAPGEVVCDGTRCPLPELAPGATVVLDLQVQVDPSATVTDVSLTVYEAPALDLAAVEVASGFATVDMVPTAPVEAGTNSQFVLTATPAEGVTNPGPVVLPTELTPDLYISGTPEGCVSMPSGTDWECAPDETGQVGPLVIDTVAVPSAEGDQQVAVTDAGGRELQADTVITVLPLNDASTIRMTGPFGGTSIAAPVLSCHLTRPDALTGCSKSGYAPVPAEGAGSRDLVTGGRTVVWAELTWAAAGATGDDSVTLDVDGTGTPVVGEVLPVTASDKDRMNVHHADVTALISGDSRISVTDLSAPLFDADHTTPFAVWSLSVVWADPTLDDATVTFTNPGLRMLPTRANALQAVLEDRETPLSSLFVLVWATDPWGEKALRVGDRVLTTDVDGIAEQDGRRDKVGYDLLTFDADQLGDATGKVTFANAVNVGGANDGVWIGPVLAIGPAAPSGD